MQKTQIVKKVKKFIVPLLVIILLFMLIGADMPIACHARGRVIERDDWRLWQFTYGSRHTTLLGLNDRSLIIDGVLTIPTRVGARNIHGFGAALAGSFDPGPGVYKIVIPAELIVGGGVWGMYFISPRPNVRYVELLCDIFDNIFLAGGGMLYTIIIPDGSTQNFYNRIRSLNFDPSGFNFIEKSNFGGIN